jgi:gamma-glutamyl hercynylcysteine S-oxide synthase
MGNSTMMPPEPLLASLAQARERTLALVDPLGDADLERVHTPIMSPLVWDLGHIAAYEDLWLAHRHAGVPLLRPDLAETYDAFETPRAVRGERRLLSREECHDYLRRVRERVERLARDGGVGDGVLHEMVLRHEHQHNETMLQTIELARLKGWVPVAPAPSGHEPAANGGGLETVEVPAGRFERGAPRGRFSFDNERPRGRVELPAFAIGRTPVTNASWLSFAEGGGYERREWWSDEGWAWKEEYDIERPGGWRCDLEPAGGDARSPRLYGRVVHEWHRGSWEPLALDRPVCHVSWFEADAFARAHGVRLPNEDEWEKAATWDQRTGETRAWPWGEDEPSSEHANLLDSGAFAPVASGSLPAGAAACGALGMIGDVWEWTATHFRPYPGFVAHPYREYSEVFFGGGYRVLRGGSWASSRRVATPTFRNWDLPIRRQIFSGVRIARDT